MARYAKKTCERCGLQRPVNQMQKVEKRVKGARSGVSFSYNAKNPGRGIRVNHGRQYYRNAKLYYCAHSAACHDPNYFVRLAAERAEEEARLAEIKSRKERVEKEIKRQIKQDSIKPFASYEDFSKEIGDCENKLDAKKKWRKGWFWCAIILFVTGMALNEGYSFLIFLIASFMFVLSSLQILPLKRTLSNLRVCAQNLKNISKERLKKDAASSSLTELFAPKSPKKEAPKSLIDKLLESDDFFNIATTALAKSIAEADGKITKEEWDAYRKNFEIDKEDFKLVEKIWAKDFSPSAFAKELAKRHKKKKIILEVILNNLFFVAEADGELASEEIEMLRNYATIFGLGPEKFARIIEGKKESVKNTDKKKTILDDGDPYIYLDELEIDDDFEFGEE